MTVTASSARSVLGDAAATEQRVTPQVTPEDGFTADEPPADRRRRFPGRLLVVSVLATALLLLLVDVVVGRLAFHVRQDHLAHLYEDTSLELPRRGGPVMVLQIEDLRMNLVVAEGADAATLRGAPGLVTGSPLPGEGGNVVIAGRSDRFGGYFAPVAGLAKKTVIVTRLRSGLVSRYEVVGRKTVGRKTVGSDDLDVLEQPSQGSDPSGDAETLTLVTSAGGPFDSRRVAVTAELTGRSEQPAGSTGSKKTARRDPGEAPESFDVRAPAGALLMAAGLTMVVLGAIAAIDLRRRHPLSTVLAVSGPAIVLGVVLFLFNLDAAIPVTF